MKVPALQVEVDEEHDAAPAVLDVPLGHATHAAADTLSVAILNVIAGQRTVAFAPVGQYEPCGQG